ncbi:FAD/NAD(P)-binding protein [Dyella silvatica]|uniref:FAD/NAD(P)-binding protein n=1 Tax=Dyella silvatica TaxID=2992128 RepID=UPI002252220E|nr:FAD/NAD(P)-binding protein [Dyella silvatica]
MKRRIAIIGGGASASTLLSELMDRPAAAPLQLDWYTGGGAYARGVAYNTRSERHLLNVRAASMSMFAGKPKGFLEFAQRGDHAIAGTDFLPRRAYGDYLEAEVEHALRRAQTAGHDVRIIPFAVDSLVPEHDGITVIQGENNHRVDAAVLAIGTLPPQPLGGVSDEALASGQYIIDPWPFLSEVSADPRPLDIALIGLGLTSADVLIELAAQWPNARFTAISRHGLLPEPHLASASAPADDSAELIEAMRDSPEIRRWTHLLRGAMAQSRDWRTVIDSLRPHTSSLWMSLPDVERARFLRHVRWAWERVRHRMPPQVNNTLDTLEHDGRLQRYRGRMQQVACSDGRLQLQILRRGGNAPTTMHADLVIQTVGLDTDVRRTQHTLVRQLVTNGHIRADPFGLGCHATPDGRLQQPGDTVPRLFAIGSLLRGVLWESTAMPEIRQQARVLADQLLAP